MLAEPALTPTINPELALTVATTVFEELHVPPPAVDVRLVVAPAHTIGLPLKTPAIGAAVTVTVLVAVALAQPPVPKTV